MQQIIQNLKSGDTTLENLPTPSCKSGHVLIQTTRSLISLGTEKMLVEFGQAGLISKARQQPDKVKMVLDKVKTDGLMPTIDSVRNKLDQPLPLGYSNVGVILEVGSGITDLKPGDRLLSNGHHAEVVCVPRNLVCKIPDTVSDEEASFTVVSAIGLQGIRLVKPTLGETVVVVGLGLIGLLTCQLLKANGCRVIGFDFDEEKVQVANNFGVIAYNSAKGIDPVAAVMELTSQVGADAVLITASTASHDVISQAANMSRQRGRIVLIGVIGLNLSRADFYEKELSFQVSCSYGPGRYDSSYEEQGQDYPLPFVRWTENRNFQAVLQAMESGALRVKELITKRVALEEVTSVYRDIQEHKNQLGIVIEYSGEVHLSKSVAISDAPKSPSSAQLAVVGAGNFSQAMILPCLKKSGAVLRTIVSSKGVSGNHAARKFGITESCSDYDSVLKDTSVDAVVITTPHNLHASMTVQALEAGKHVFVEKPLALTMDELEAVKSAQQKHPKQHVVVGFNRRFSPLTQKLKSIVSSSVQPMNLIFTANAGFIPKDHWTQDPLVGGGRILGEACHFIDLCSYVAGSRVKKVSASALGLQADRYSDNVMITLQFENGSQGVINYLSNGSKAYSKERMEAFSEGRVLILDNFRQLEGYHVSGFKKLKLSKQDKGHQEQFSTWLKTLKDGGQPMVPFADLVNSTQASLAVLESLEKKGLPIEV